MTTASALPRVATGEPRLTFRADRAAATADISHTPANRPCPLRAERP
jgi:hypothetical protein